MPANLAAFALHVENPARAIAFYEAVFSWRFEPWGPPGFYLIHTGDEASPGVLGLLNQRDEPVAGIGLNGIEPTFSVDDVDGVITAVQANGGQIRLEKFVIPTVGTGVSFLDPDGNRISAMTYETPPQT